MALNVVEEWRLGGVLSPRCSAEGHSRSHSREALGWVSSPREQGEDVEKSLYCGVPEKQQARQRK